MADKDRRTRMLVSSVNAPAKKGGAGGGYTWGSVQDVTYLEGQSVTAVGVATTFAATPTNVGVITAPAPQVVQPVQVLQAPNIMDQSAFPSLGAAPVVSPVQSWGGSRVMTVGTGTMVAAAPAALSEASLRPGALDVFNSQHPRNMFAKKPYVRPATTLVETASPVQEGLIDWSKAGLPDAVVKSILTSNQGAAHLGPYAMAAPSSVPLEVLRPQATFVQQQIKNTMPSVMKKPLMQQPIIQPQKR
jgi:hypothetical protein